MTPPIGSARAGVVSQVDAIPDSVANNLDIWHPMDEGSAGTLNDALETQNASLINGSNWESNDGWGGTSPILNGTDQWFRSDNTVNASNQGTLVTWFKLDTLSDGGLIAATDNATNPTAGVEIAFISSANRTGSLYYRGNTRVSGTGGVSGINSTNTWYFLAATFDLSTDTVTQYLYDNNTQIGSNSQTGGNPANSLLSTAELYGGFDQFNNVYLDGNVDAAGVNASTKLSKSTIDQIWGDTQR